MNADTFECRETVVVITVLFGAVVVVRCRCPVFVLFVGVVVRGAVSAVRLLLVESWQFTFYINSSKRYTALNYIKML